MLKNLPTISVKPFYSILLCAGIRANCGGLPPTFEVNVGQEDAAVKFLSRGSGHSVFATDHEIVLSFCARNSMEHHVLRMKLRDFSPPEGHDAVAAVTNYVGKVGSFANIGNFRQLRYRSQISPIDLVLHYRKLRDLEYQWIVWPGADPGQISFLIEGADDLRLAATGDLVLKAGSSEIRYSKPMIYQQMNGIRRQIMGSFRLVGRRTVAFRVTSYDKSRPLVIDPVVSYAIGAGDQGLYEAPIQGGNLLDTVRGLAVDAAGNTYITGNTFSPTFPKGGPPLQLSETPYPYKIFVAKLGPDGSQFVYTTLFNEEGTATGIAVDASGAAYITGTAGTNISTSPVTYKAGPGGGGDVFVVKLNASGSSLVYNTYIGGSGLDQSNGIAVDGLGNAYVAGSTSSADYPVTSGAFQTAYKSTSGMAFVSKLNASGVALVYSTYLGGTTADDALAIAVDTMGHAYVAGQAGINFPVTQGAFQAQASASPDAFIAKLSADGTSLLYSTLIGGDGLDQANAVAIDGSGNAYITGSTTSVNFPVTLGALQKSPLSAGSYSAFVTKINGNGSSLIYSTYFGGLPSIGHAIAVDSSNNAYIAGETGDLLPILHAVQSSFYPAQCVNFSASGTTPISSYPCSDAFVAALDPSGSGLLFSTYLNGYKIDQVLGLALDPERNVYVGGTGELSLAAGNSASSNGAAFVVKLDPSRVPPFFTTQSITNAASFVSGLVSPGGLATIFLAGLTGVNGIVRATSLPLPTELAGVTVTIAGTAAPLLAVTDIDQQQQINFQVPSEIGSDLQAADVVVKQNGVFASVTQEKIHTTPPGVFRVDATHGAIQHSADFSLVTSSHPAAKGEVVVVYATGLGAVNPTVPSGYAAPLSKLSRTTQAPTVLIDGHPSELLFSGLTPGSVGLYQLNVRVPQGVHSGDVDLVVKLPAVFDYPPPMFIGTTIVRDSQPVKISLR